MPLLHRAVGIFVHYVGCQRGLRRGIRVSIHQRTCKIYLPLSLTNVYIRTNVVLQSTQVLVKKVSSAKIHLSCVYMFVLCIKSSISPRHSVPEAIFK